MSSERQYEWDASRHIDIFKASMSGDHTLHIVGAGAIGSHLCYHLAKLGVRQAIVYDYDVVEPHNLPNQWFWGGDVGKNKSEVIADTLNRLRGEEIFTKVVKKVESEDDLIWDSSKKNILFSCVDSWDARRTLAELAEFATFDLVIDGRIAVSHYDIIVGQRDKWLTTFPEEGEEPFVEVSHACGAPLSVGFVADGCAGTMASLYAMYAREGAAHIPSFITQSYREYTGASNYE